MCRTTEQINNFDKGEPTDWLPKRGTLQSWLSGSLTNQVFHINRGEQASLTPSKSASVCIYADIRQPFILRCSTIKKKSFCTIISYKSPGIKKKKDAKCIFMVVIFANEVLFLYVWQVFNIYRFLWALKLFALIPSKKI